MTTLFDPPESAGESQETVGSRLPLLQAGTRTEGAATAADAITKARLNWKVAKVPLTMTRGYQTLPIRNRFAVVREDHWEKPPLTGAAEEREGPCPILGIVGREYQPLQNSDAFAFFDEIVKSGRATYEWAGAFGHGWRIWVLVKMTKELRVVGDDVVYPYLLLTNSHDGSSSVQVRFTPVRVFCENCLTTGQRGGPAFSITHRRALVSNLAVAQRTLGEIEQRFDQMGDDFTSMAHVALNGSMLDEFLGRVFPIPREGAEAKTTRRMLQCRDRAAHLFEHGAGNRHPDVKGTLWAAYNGVTELADHHLAGGGASRRLESIWFGESHTIKSRSLSAARDLMREWAR
ncbi:MAG: DUF945 domain-containing protein [Chloroflexi bacterium]|nr:DUF945 domain-containing protein [Chloroflexota bacterium]